MHEPKEPQSPDLPATLSYLAVDLPALTGAGKSAAPLLHSDIHAYSSEPELCPAHGIDTSTP